jgi:DNA repair protein RecN (Recombination protein N)
MLKTLSIVNYALIENLEIELEDGFSVITGETGAGKSIILGALSLILGSRADLHILRDKNKKCIIEGVFDNGKLDIEPFFKENDLDLEKQTIIRRELLPSGKSRAFINDTPVNLKQINYLGNKFVNIHSQHQTLRLTDASFQLNVLDDFIDKPKPLKDFQNAFQKYKYISEKLKILTEQNNQAAKDEDYFKFQFEELSSISINAAELAELELKAQYLEHNEEIKLALSEAESILNSEEHSVVDGISGLTQVLGNIESFLPSVKKILERLNSISIEINDIASEIEIQNSNEDFNPEELLSINGQLSSIYTLIQKHQVGSIEELIQLRDEYDKKLQNIESFDFEIKKLSSELVILESRLKDKASILTNLRLKSGKSFSMAVLAVLKNLGMKDAGFNIKLEELTSFCNTGMDKIQFVFNANLGGEPGEISKIASGGELSRLMLAIKSLINHRQMLPTVIFDEIDTGVSGEIAGKVGRILQNMAENHQVISITHLPQIASKANHHYKAHKITSINSTVTTIDKLDNEARVDELAMMLSSEKVTKTAINVAREMLEG